MIIEYGFIGDESGMAMNAVVPDVQECSYSGDTVFFIYINPKGEKVEMKKDLKELTSFNLRK